MLSLYGQSGPLLGSNPLQYVDSYYRLLSEPVRFKKSVPWQQAFTTDWEPVTDLRLYWYCSLSEPVRFKKAVPWQQPFVTDWKLVNDLRLRWLNQLTEPVRSKKAVAWQQPFATDWQWTVSAPPVSWFSTLSEPVWSRVPFKAQQTFTTDWKWDAPPIGLFSYTLSVTETGDTGAFVFTSFDIIVGANVTITEVWIEGLANVTITEIEE